MTFIWCEGFLRQCYVVRLPDSEPFFQHWMVMSHKYVHRWSPSPMFSCGSDRKLDTTHLNSDIFAWITYRRLERRYMAIERFADVCIIHFAFNLKWHMEGVVLSQEIFPFSFPFHVSFIPRVLDFNFWSRCYWKTFIYVPLTIYVHCCISVCTVRVVQWQLNIGLLCPAFLDNSLALAFHSVACQSWVVPFILPVDLSYSPLHMFII